MLVHPSPWPYEVTEELLEALSIKPKPNWEYNFMVCKWRMSRDDYRAIMEAAEKKIVGLARARE